MADEGKLQTAEEARAERDKKLADRLRKKAEIEAEKETQPKRRKFFDTL